MVHMLTPEKFFPPPEKLEKPVKDNPMSMLSSMMSLLWDLLFFQMTRWPSSKNWQQKISMTTLHCSIIDKKFMQIEWMKRIHLKQFHQLHLLIQLQLEILETRKASLRIQFSSIQKLPSNCPTFLTLNQSTWP